MPENVVNLLASIAGDASVPGAATAGAVAEIVIGAALEKLNKRRLREAAAFFLEELRSGSRDTFAGAPDEAAAIIERYLRAAREGAARRNLRLLARIAAGHRVGHELFADEFLRLADILAPLSREELLVLGCLHRHRLAQEVGENDGARESRAMAAAVDELIPDVVRDRNEFSAVAGALMRTGLVLGLSAFGGLVYVTSSRMDRLVQVAGLGAFNQVDE